MAILEDALTGGFIVTGPAVGVGAAIVAALVIPGSTTDRRATTSTTQSAATMNPALFTRQTALR
jgi:hypothetical protein